MNALNLYPLVYVILGFGLLGAILRFNKFRKDQRTRAPVEEAFLRPPGESLRIKLQTIDDQIMTGITVYCLFLFMASGWFITITEPSNSVMQGTAQIVCIPFLLGTAVWILSRANLYRDYSLGFFGERLVGDELNRLSSDECRIFHDFPADPKWNIDHVIVSTTGVFIVETKTRRKLRGSPQKGRHRVTYDGQCLHFPNRQDRDALRQTLSNTSWMGEFLSSALGEKVPVQGILTLPGWYIDRTGKGPVHVLNPKEIRKLLNGKPIFSQKQFQYIAHLIEQKCKDVRL